MAAEDQTDGMVQNNTLNSLNTPRSGAVNRLKELYSFKNEQAPKVRKPYTITKQREKWTEGEHQKFLEALKLYGRGWRQIEEHVGTKTAVQIRSHAQKFFSKVVRESNGGSEGCVGPIEIPPPRPKRKPMHPYPRKSVDSVKGGSPPTQTERSKSPNESTGEQDNNSPTSVLSPFASDMLASAVSEQQNGCSSPTSCTTNMQSTNASPVGKVNEDETSKSAAEAEKVSQSAIKVSPPSLLDDFLSMKFDAGFKDSVCANGDEAGGAPSTSIKLFGKRVLVDSCKPSQGLENTKLLITRTSHENFEVDGETVVRTSTSKHVDTDLSLGMVSGNYITAPGATVTMCFVEKSDSVGPVCDATRPWWVMYQGLPYDLSLVDPNVVRAPENSCIEERVKQEIPTERSCTGSNAGSVTQPENKERNSDSVDSECHPPHLDVAHDRRHNYGRGFVPYKRCLAERDVSSPVMVSEEQERQRTRVCS